MSDYAFHPELFEHRTEALDELAKHNYIWLEHFSSVDLLHDLFGLEICGIAEKSDASAILAILEARFPRWMFSDIYYHEYERDRGWKVLIFQNPERGRDFKTA